MKALMLAAGYATRLWPLTINRPKPLLGINGRPILEYIIAKIERIKAIDEILIITNSRFFRHFQRWKSCYRSGQEITIIDDGIDCLERRLGSIGDIIFAVENRRIDCDMLVIAGDNIFSSGIDGFIDKAQANSPYATVGLYDIKDFSLAERYGIVELNDDSRIASFEEKPQYPKSTLAAMCLYYLPRQKIELLKRYKAEGKSLDLAGHFIKWLASKEPVYGYIFKGYWMDIGDRKSLKKAREVAWA